MSPTSTAKEQRDSPGRIGREPASGFTHLLLENVHPNTADLLRQRGHEVIEQGRSLTDQALLDGLRAVDVLGIRSKTCVREAALAASPRLRAIGCFCIGTNQVALDAAAARGVVVFNAPFSNTRSVAELTIAEIIALHRRLTEKSHAVHEGRWDKSAAHAHEVRGRTLGIVGYGHIGSQLSVLAEAIGMRVIYFDVANKLPLGNAQTCASLDELLGRADVVSIHVPETEQTKGMIGEQEIARMKRGAFLINNARGTVVDLDAAARALRANHLFGAAVDVYPDEPAGNDSPFETPLAGLPNVILTPHIGGSTEEAQANIALDVTNKILRFLENGSTTDAVNVPEVDLPQLRPNQHRILHFHRNVPGVLSNINRVLADADVNINAEYLQSRGDVSYVILDVDPINVAEIDGRLSAIPETIRMRVLG